MMYSLLFVLLPYSMTGFAPAAAPHPIHLSVMDIYSEEGRSQLEFSITLFLDDFGVAVDYPKHQDAINSGKLTVDELIMDYLKEKMTIKINGKPIKYRLKEKETNFPSVTCYMEVTGIDPTAVQNLEVESKVMLELFDDQKNMVNIRIDGKKKGAMILNQKKTSATATF